MKKNYLEPRIKVNTISIEAVMMDVSNTPVGGFDVRERTEGEADDHLLDGLFD